MQWHVELTCKDSILLAFLTTCLQEPSCTVIEKNSDRFYALERDGQPLYRSSDFPEARQGIHYYWLSTDFDQYTDAQDVLTHAQQQVPLLNSILRLKYSVRISALHVDDVYCADEQGRLIKQTAVFPSVTGRRVTTESLLQTINAQHPSIAELWQGERKYPEVEEAMRHFANQRNWFNLDKVYEVIEHDVGKDTIQQWMSGQADDFTYSANNARVSGLDARHFSAKFHKTSTKRTPISLQQATEFVSNLLLRWFHIKPL